MKLAIEAQTVIERPASEVFSFVAIDHCRNHPRWDPSVLRIIPPSDGVMALGRRLEIVRQTLGREETHTFEVTEWQPPTLMTIATHSPDFDLSLASECVALTDESTRLVLRASARVSGPRALLLPIMRMKFRADIQHNLERIKGLIEAPAPVAAAEAF